MATNIVLQWPHSPLIERPKKMYSQETFFRHFQSSASVIQEHIDRLPSVAAVAGERLYAFEYILARIARLSNEVKDAADFLPAYDQRTYAEALKAINDRANNVYAKASPKAAFRFRAAQASNFGYKENRDRRHLLGPNLDELDAPASAAPSEPQKPVGKDYNEEMSRAGADGGIRKPSFSTAQMITLANHTGIHIMLPAGASRATSSGSLTNLKRCIVDMSAPTRGGTKTGGAPFASLAIRDVERALIVAGHVSGPTHITGVKDSVIVVAARQVRMHDCRNVDVYLHCASHPIIEDCSGVRVAPLPKCYMDETTDPEKNQWDQVDDFKWLKTEPSPNWSTLPENERVPEKVWVESVPGGPTLGFGDILKLVGVPE